MRVECKPRRECERAATNRRLESATDQVIHGAKSDVYDDYADTKGAMDDIARETGGQAFIGNDLKKIMERGIEQGINVLHTGV